MPNKLPILILQYAIQGHVRRTEHWSIAVITDTRSSSARIFEMKGNTDSFAFGAKDVHNIAASSSYCGGVQIGEIDVKELENLETWLKCIAIRHNDPQWDCQDWVMDALRELKMDNRGVVFDDMTERYIRKEMNVEKERDEMGQDTVHDRLKM
ncbi:hypothetical protein SCHPADRAFT_899348 [Schizopora paradoxa]|uniref:Uncharacterized protein n=1 Tax=Schizopora paradoxa TaxID=27342 RepID=A0A0H2S3W7_9AGAM|nr:hypothetical protein SCHPADRAFT_899348 [Schizopora paradoxa]